MNPSFSLSQKFRTSQRERKRSATSSRCCPLPTRKRWRLSSRTSSGKHDKPYLSFLCKWCELMQWRNGGFHQITVAPRYNAELGVQHFKTALYRSALHVALFVTRGNYRYNEARMYVGMISFRQMVMYEWRLGSNSDCELSAGLANVLVVNLCNFTSQNMQRCS